ncbi:hypothetical protein K737_300054 [Holospora undulata HU1]|uniref:Uncharacterized protein n=2 Tax=Holospora TaxID=44747 RepID=A0A061JIK3_9PROT|nr:hypothetical protein K737_300054 [Holospora undulata HU1]
MIVLENGSSIGNLVITRVKRSNDFLNDLKWKILFCYADHWADFNKIIPSTCLFQRKDKTLSIEQNNGQHRHWFARFRPPLANTRSLEMLEGTLRIFAELHVNKTLKINHAIFG